MAHGWPETGWWKGSTSPSQSRPTGRESCRATAPRSTSSSGENTGNWDGTTRRPGQHILTYSDLQERAESEREARIAAEAQVRELQAKLARRDHESQGQG